MSKSSLYLLSIKGAGSDKHCLLLKVGHGEVCPLIEGILRRVLWLLAFWLREFDRALEGGLAKIRLLLEDGLAKIRLLLESRLAKIGLLLKNRMREIGLFLKGVLTEIRLAREVHTGKIKLLGEKLITNFLLKKIEVFILTGEMKHAIRFPFMITVERRQSRTRTVGRPELTNDVGYRRVSHMSYTTNSLMLLLRLYPALEVRERPHEANGERTYALLRGRLPLCTLLTR